MNGETDSGFGRKAWFEEEELVRCCCKNEDGASLADGIDRVTELHECEAE